MRAQDKIRALLNARGWSHSELARRAGLRQRVVSYIVSEGREPRVTAAIAIATALDTPVAWLFDDKADWPPPPESTSIQNEEDSVVVADALRRRQRAALVCRQFVARYEELRDKHKKVDMAANGDRRAADGEFNKDIMALHSQFWGLLFGFITSYGWWMRFDLAWSRLIDTSGVRGQFSVEFPGVLAVIEKLVYEVVGEAEASRQILKLWGIAEPGDGHVLMFQRFMHQNIHSWQTVPLITDFDIHSSFPPPDGPP